MITINTVTRAFFGLAGAMGGGVGTTGGGTGWGIGGMGGWTAGVSIPFTVSHFDPVAGGFLYSFPEGILAAEARDVVFIFQQ